MLYKVVYLDRKYIKDFLIIEIHTHKYIHKNLKNLQILIHVLYKYILINKRIKLKTLKN